MIINDVKAIGNKVTYWYLNTPTAKMLNMRTRYFSDSWLPDLYYNIVDIEEFAKSYRKDFTHSEFIMEVLMLIVEYQHQMQQGYMSQRVFSMKMENINRHFEKNQINITLNL